MIHDDGSLWLLIPLTILALVIIQQRVWLYERRHGKITPKPGSIWQSTDSILFTVKLFLPKKFPKR